VDEKQVPHCDLAVIKRLMGNGQADVTNRVNRHLRVQQWDDCFPCRCIGMTRLSDFHKSQRHRDRPEQWLDIYRPWVDGVRMYVKFTVDADGDVIIMSLCRDGEAH
jgi:hypothetical protein